MARTASGRKGAGKKSSAKRAAPKAKTAGRKKAAAAPPRKTVAKKAAARAKTSVKKAAVKKTALRKAGPKKASARVAAKRPATRPPVTKVTARVPVARRPPVRRARAVTPVRRKSASPRLKTPAQTQRFAASHLNEADFKPDGLRAYALYRDLGMSDASGGLCQAHVIRLLSPCTDEVRKRHMHEPELQLIYVLKGWVKNEFEGEGIQMMSVGSCWLQPPGIRHTVLDYSPDVELLEIIVPADFKTTEVD
jgi:mannose-6-phosphate isomerase-like protein (cupin superfamily)